MHAACRILFPCRSLAPWALGYSSLLQLSFTFRNNIILFYFPLWFYFLSFTIFCDLCLHQLWIVADIPTSKTSLLHVIYTWLEKKKNTCRKSSGFCNNSWGLLAITWPNFFLGTPSSANWSTINFILLVEQPNKWGCLLIARSIHVFGTYIMKHSIISLVLLFKPLFWPN